MVWDGMGWRDRGGRRGGGQGGCGYMGVGDSRGRPTGRRSSYTLYSFGHGLFVRASGDFRLYHSFSFPFPPFFGGSALVCIVSAEPCGTGGYYGISVFLGGVHDHVYEGHGFGGWGHQRGVFSVCGGGFSFIQIVNTFLGGGRGGDGLWYKKEVGELLYARTYVRAYVHSFVNIIFHGELRRCLECGPLVGSGVKAVVCGLYA